MSDEMQAIKTEVIEANKEARATKVEVAELKGTILTEIRHLSHDIRNMMQAMSAFVPRPEIERLVSEMKDKIEEVKKEATAAIIAHQHAADKKFEAYEEEKRFIRRTLFASIAAGAASWAFWLLRH